MEVDILNKKPRLRNRANGELGDALDTKQGNCRPTSPTNVIEQSFNSTKIRRSIMILVPEISKSDLPLGWKLVINPVVVVS